MTDNRDDFEDLLERLIYTNPEEASMKAPGKKEKPSEVAAQTSAAAEA